MMRRIVLALVALIAGWCAVLLFMGLQFMYSPANPGSPDVIFSVEPGPFAKTAQNLASQGLTKDAFKMRMLAKFTGYANKIQVGEYKLDAGMTPIEILQEISSGKTIQYPFTMSEGLNIFEIANLMESQSFAKAQEVIAKCFDKSFFKKYLGDVHSCEGYLFPETYNFNKSMSLEAKLGVMIKKFLERYKELEVQYSNFYLNRHEIVTLASIIEKETGADEERALVSSVYQNRLKIGMRLQADPTVLYGMMDTSKKLENNIRRKDLLTPNRYNTYAMKGLPFGPIANPGFASLKAVFTPATADYLYFVSKNDGTHVFSKDFSVHSANVQSLQKNPEARKGKSWKDLAKSKTQKSPPQKSRTR
ncbi:MAG: endolytic transglycosylase MltG [Bdellovibrionales bacterium]